MCIALCAVAATGAKQKQAMLRHVGKTESFVRALEYNHQLRVCNAYPYAATLDVYRGKGEKLTGDSPMAYKACRDFVAPLKTGDKLEFKVGDASAGTFAVSELPKSDAVMLLVIHRHDTLSTAVAFESHVFASLQNAQIAIIDTYKGTALATPRITDSGSHGKAKDTKDVKDTEAARSEELRYNSVVAVNPGVYEVALAGEDGETKAQSELVALNHESYVVLRTGVEAQQGTSYPEELVIFPQSDAKALHSSAVGVHVSLLLMLLCGAAITA